MAAVSAAIFFTTFARAMIKSVVLKIFLICCFSIFLSFSKENKTIHPYHVGSVEFNYNKKSQTFEITGRFFTDDLENAVSKKAGKTLRFHESKQKELMNKALEAYASEYLKLKVNSNFVNVNYLGFEEDRESVNVYLESERIADPKKIETAVSFIYNLYDDQLNIIHIIIDGQRKSSKLGYPDRYLYQQF